MMRGVMGQYKILIAVQEMHDQMLTIGLTQFICNLSSQSQNRLQPKGFAEQKIHQGMNLKIEQSM